MKSSLLCLSMLLATSVFAKLPVPVLTDEAKAKAEEAKAKTAWAAKVDSYKLCLSMDRAAGNYFKTATASGKLVNPAVAGVPTCADPGPFTYVAAAAIAVAKPVEAGSSHSPSTLASSPPTGKAPAAVPTGK